MLKKIIIHNFQSYKHAEINLCSGINTITGLPESGKTRIFKAIKWVAENRPIGDTIRRNKSKETYVSLLFSDDNEITRYKSNKENSYILNGMEFKAVGIYVPEEVEQVINMNYINFQSQFEPHFLLSNSPAEIASFFNRLANVEKIDDSIIYVNSKIKDINSNLKFEEERNENLNEKIKTFDSLLDFEDHIEEIEKIKDSVNRLDNYIDKIEEIILSYNNIDKLIARYEYKISLKPTVDKGFELLKEVEKLNNEISNKESIIYELEYYDQEIEKLNNENEKLKKQLKDNFPKNCPLCGKET
ncbi:AAA family ATPase [Candidatus Micrarchaeota archaeon]|nr:AAA family ATPase [Candidatus Micrarchaeota archaeon]